jgi:hypothetical protein
MDSYTSTKGSKYVKINGLIMQWGTVSLGSTTYTSFTFQVPFSSTDYVLVAEQIQNNSYWGQYTCYDKSTTGFGMVKYKDASKFNWLAIGY